jgi:hypothetical protein
MDGFCPARSVFENLINILQAAEVLIYFHEKRVSSTKDGFDLILFSGGPSRVIVRKKNGFNSMVLPFQIIEDGEVLSLVVEEFSEIVDGKFISIMRNALSTVLRNGISSDEISMGISESFGLDILESCRYCDIFFHLISEDHGYFRFDDDAANENGKFHPRFHLDFFLKNSSTLKIGLDQDINLETLISMFDPTRPKWFLRQ